MRGTWGDRVVIAAGLTKKIANLLIDTDPSARPETFTIFVDIENVLGTKGPSAQDPTFNYGIRVRWLAGGADLEVTVKARATGNVFVVAGQAVEVYVSSDDGGNPEVRAHAIIVPGRTEPAIVENAVGGQIAAAGTLDVTIPRFAGAVRFCGWPATVTAKFRDSGATDMNATALDCSQENFRAIPRQATVIRLTNGDAAAQRGAIQFEVF